MTAETNDELQEQHEKMNDIRGQIFKLVAMTDDPKDKSFLLIVLSVVDGVKQMAREMISQSTITRQHAITLAAITAANNEATGIKKVLKYIAPLVQTGILVCLAFAFNTLVKTEDKVNDLDKKYEIHVAKDHGAKIEMPGMRK